MASLQIINRRIKSVRGIRQITKAMQMVAASELRRAQTAALGPQAYTDAATEMLARLSGQPVVKRHPLLQKRPVKRALTILIAGDRGLAGGYNSNIIRAYTKHLRETPGEHLVISVGKRAAMYIGRISDAEQLAAYEIDEGNVSTSITLPVLEEVAQMYQKGEIDLVHLITTDFISTVKQKVNVSQLLPIIVPPDTKPQGDSDMEPEPEELVDFAIRRILEAQMVQALLEARAAEQAARMLAMMNATENADDIIGALTLVYNNERQSGITQEISEITAGAEAIAKA